MLEKNKGPLAMRKKYYGRILKTFRNEKERIRKYKYKIALWNI